MITKSIITHWKSIGNHSSARGYTVDGRLVGTVIKDQDSEDWLAVLWEGNRCLGVFEHVEAARRAVDEASPASERG